MDIEEGPIWAVLRSKAPDHAPAIKELARDVAGKLRLVRDTFPTYTLHDELHAANVVRIMGRLLGDRVTELSGLEAAILVLAAYHHDIGMVYTPAELAEVSSEPAFAAYLSTHHEDYLAVRAAGGEPPLDVLERYCRSRHADRVYDHLGGLSDRLVWGNAPLYKALGEVCRSHNLPAGALRSDDLDPDFLAGCDLRLCALLLRLADILDLDASRAPRAVYDHLDLAGRHTARTAVSDGEWRKHLCADGFAFPSARPPNYPLPFIAGPDHPAVEHDIRAFLDVVDDELRRARPVLDTCAPRWRDLALPGEVDRRAIIGRGYTYGEFRFELDRAAVLRLFMGERLYEDPYVFVRELLQNAIDAVRLRQALGLATTGTPGVAVTTWEDADGFLWVRVDDDGVGMDERTLREYFLRVGRSYYNSAELRADLARGGRPDDDFMAISRFGIGVLSCFIAGDLVELSTLRVLPDGSVGKPLRLSLARDEEFFVLRQQPDRPTAMPAKGRAETGYRRHPGTGVAVRIDPTEVDVTAAELVGRLDDYVSNPPLPVSQNGRPAGRPAVDDLDHPLLDSPITEIVVASPSWQRRVLDGDDTPYVGPLEVGLLALDLTAAAPTPKLRGQLLVFGARVPPAPGGRPASDLLAGWPADELARVPVRLRELAATAVLGHSVTTKTHYVGYLTAEVRQTVGRETSKRLRDELEPFRQQRSLLGALARMFWQAPDRPLPPFTTDFGGRSLPTLAGRSDLRFAPPRVSHNGVSLPARGGLAESQYGLVIVGSVAFSDHLRPDLAISRATIRAMPFVMHSAAQYALRRSLLPHAAGRLAWLATPAANIDLLSAAPADPPSLGMALRDPLVAEGHWDEVRILNVDGRATSAADLRHLAAAGETVQLRDIAAPRFAGPLGGWRANDFIRPAIMRTRLDLTWSLDGWYRVRTDRVPVLPAGLRWFPPLYFVPYDAPERLLYREGDPIRDVHPPLNLANPLARWLADRADALESEMPVIFRHIRQALDRRERRDFNPLLERVAGLRPDLAPPPEAYLRDEYRSGELWTR